MSLASKLLINNPFEEKSVFTSIKRKNTSQNQTVSKLTLNDKKKTTKIQGIKLDLALIKRKHTSTGLRNIYSNYLPLHGRISSAEADTLLTSSCEKNPRSILKRTSNKSSSKEVRFTSSSASLRDYKSVKFELKNNQINKLNKNTSKEEEKAGEEAKCNCIIY